MRPQAHETKRLEWERPTILCAASLADALGDCVGGSTEITGTNGGCFNGNNTLGTAPGGHVCQAGNTQP